MKLYIESDGTTMGTKVTNAEGEMVENVESISWELHTNDEIPRVVITLIGPDIKIEHEDKYETTLDVKVPDEPLTIPPSDQSRR